MNEKRVLFYFAFFSSQSLPNFFPFCIYFISLGRIRKNHERCQSKTTFFKTKHEKVKKMQGRVIISLRSGLKNVIRTASTNCGQKLKKYEISFTQPGYNFTAIIRKA